MFSLTPQNWLSNANADQELSLEDTDEQHGMESRPRRRRRPAAFDRGSELNDVIGRNQRNRKRPSKFDEYICHSVYSLTDGDDRLDNTARIDYYYQPCSRRLRSVEAVQQHLRCSHLREKQAEHDSTENDDRLFRETGLRWKDVRQLRVLEQTTPMSTTTTLPPTAHRDMLSSGTQTDESRVYEQSASIVAMVTATTTNLPTVVNQLPSRSMSFAGIESGVINVILDPTVPHINEAAVRLQMLLPNLDTTEAEKIAASAYTGARAVAQQVCQAGNGGFASVISLLMRFEKPAVDLKVIPTGAL
jgi:hypothetical protein